MNATDPKPEPPAPQNAASPPGPPAGSAVTASPLSRGLRGVVAFFRKPPQPVRAAAIPAPVAPAAALAKRISGEAAVVSPYGSDYWLPAPGGPEAAEPVEAPALPEAEPPAGIAPPEPVAEVAAVEESTPVEAKLASDVSDLKEEPSLAGLVVPALALGVPALTAFAPAFPASPAPVEEALEVEVAAAEEPEPAEANVETSLPAAEAALPEPPSADLDLVDVDALAEAAVPPLPEITAPVEAWLEAREEVDLDVVVTDELPVPPVPEELTSEHAPGVEEAPAAEDLPAPLAEEPSLAESVVSAADELEVASLPDEAVVPPVAVMLAEVGSVELDEALPAPPPDEPASGILTVPAAADTDVEAIEPEESVSVDAETTHLPEPAGQEVGLGDFDPAASLVSLEAIGDEAVILPATGEASPEEADVAGPVDAEPGAAPDASGGEFSIDPIIDEGVEQLQHASEGTVAEIAPVAVARPALSFLDEAPTVETGEAAAESVEVLAGGGEFVNFTEPAAATPAQEAKEAEDHLDLHALAASVASPALVEPLPAPAVEAELEVDAQTALAGLVVWPEAPAAPAPPVAVARPAEEEAAAELNLLHFWPAADESADKPEGPALPEPPVSEAASIPPAAPAPVSSPFELAAESEAASFLASVARELQTPVVSAPFAEAPPPEELVPAVLLEQTAPPVEEPQAVPEPEVFPAEVATVEAPEPPPAVPDDELELIETVEPPLVLASLFGAIPAPATEAAAPAPEPSPFEIAPESAAASILAAVARENERPPVVHAPADELEMPPPFSVAEPPVAAPAPALDFLSANPELEKLDTPMVSEFRPALELPLPDAAELPPAPFLPAPAAKAVSFLQSADTPPAPAAPVDSVPPWGGGPFAPAPAGAMAGEPAPVPDEFWSRFAPVPEAGPPAQPPAAPQEEALPPFPAFPAAQPLAPGKEAGGKPAPRLEPPSQDKSEAEPLPFFPHSLEPGIAPLAVKAEELELPPDPTVKPKQTVPAWMLRSNPFDSVPKSDAALGSPQPLPVIPRLPRGNTFSLPEKLEAAEREKQPRPEARSAALAPVPVPIVLPSKRVIQPPPESRPEGAPVEMPSKRRKPRSLASRAVPWLWAMVFTMMAAAVYLYREEIIAAVAPSRVPKFLPVTQPEPPRNVPAPVLEIPTAVIKPVVPAPAPEPQPAPPPQPEIPPPSVAAPGSPVPMVVKPVEQVKPPEPAPAPPVAADATLDTPPAPEIRRAAVPSAPRRTEATPTDPEEARAREAVLRLVRADSVEAVIAEVANPDKVGGPLKNYHASRPPVPLRDVVLETQYRGEVPGSTNKAFIFSVINPEHPRGFPVSVEWGTDGYKADWESYIQWHDRLLAHFAETKPAGPLHFFVILRRTHYFNNDVAGSEGMLCFNVASAIPGDNGASAFVEKTSPVGRQLAEAYDWGKIYFPVVELEFVKDSAGNPYLRLNRVVRPTWRRGGR